MWFKLTYSMHGMHVRRSDLLPSVMQANDGGDEIVLWNRKLEGHPAHLCCDAIVSKKLNCKLQAMFESLAAQKLPVDNPPQVVLPHDLSMGFGGPVIDEEGNIPLEYHVPAGIFPLSFQNLQSNVNGELSLKIRSFIKLIRWMQGATGSQSPFAHVGYYWSLDKINWNDMPSAAGISVLETKGIDGSPEALSRVRDAWIAGAREPLGHELIREAIDQSRANPRSALLIGFSALETGLKKYIQEILPNSEYILEKIQSPPVITLTQEVIPNIHKAKGIVTDAFPFCKEVKEYLQKWVSQRNQIAHGSKSDLNQEELSGFLRFVRSTLYSLDFCRGCEWAGAHIKEKEHLF